ncbi:MAG: 50S ribosomal protein L17 [Gemmatimonadota bacterium]|nr:50S ribosomal protein L17 [Gemmatimonadota bacterium]
MRHGKRGRKLGRTASHKKAMLNNMATSLFTHGSIRTTHAKAKELRGVAERLITFAKRGDLHARRQVLRRIRNQRVVARLFDEIAVSFSERNGGYLRLLKLGPRRGDRVEMCLVEMVGEESGADSAGRPESDVDDGVRSESGEPAETSAGDVTDAASQPASESSGETDSGQAGESSEARERTKK